jgi:hypothetical protein
VKIKDNKVETYPFDMGQLKKENKNVSFPSQISNEMMASYGVYPVTYGETPEINVREKKTEINSVPTLKDGAYILEYTISDKTSEEIKEYDDNVINMNRLKRNGLLRETDFYALSDVTMSSEMQSYRQALRDITAHENWPNLEDADWPTAP